MISLGQSEDMSSSNSSRLCDDRTPCVSISGFWLRMGITGQHSSSGSGRAGLGRNCPGKTEDERKSLKADSVGDLIAHGRPGQGLPEPFGRKQNPTSQEETGKR